MKKNEKLILFIPLIIIVLTFITILVRGHINLNDINFDKLGGLGSFIGGLVGTFLTIVATLYIYKTYHSQKEELKSQKKELILQRQLIAQQQFESTFFNMLNVHRELKKNLKYSNLYSEKFGLDVLKYINDEYKRNFLIINETYNGEENLYSVNLEIKKNIQEYKNDEFSLEKSKIHFSYKLVFYNFQNSISHYCRNVYHILKYIRENEKNEILGKNSKKYKNYANIFQSQLNVDEQFLLFYNFIHFNDKENGIYSTINLVNHYKFLENIGIENLILKKHEEFYDFVIKGSDRKIEKK